MSNPAIFFDDWENKPFIVPVSNCTKMRLHISTRSYNAVVDWGDGTYLNYNSSKNVDATVNSISSATKSYSPNFTGDIKVYLKGGLKDVYSISFSYDRFSYFSSSRRRFSSRQYSSSTVTPNSTAMR